MRVTTQSVGGKASLLDDMVHVPAGAFVMGDERFDRETPERELWVDEFWIDRFMVTNAQFLDVATAEGIALPAHWADGAFPQGNDDHPAEVNWEQATAYAQAVGKRLPWEIEWEKAARGDDRRLFPWGDVFDPECALTWETAAVSGAHSESVRARPQGASPYGCEQMVGLCEEWCADEYDAYPGSAYSSAGYGIGMRVLRGGSWIFPQTHARCSYRCFESADLDTTGFAQLGGPGFRCVTSEVAA